MREKKIEKKKKRGYRRKERTELAFTEFRAERTRLEKSFSSLAPLACYTQGNGSNEITYERCRGFSVCRRVPYREGLHSGSIPRLPSAAASLARSLAWLNKVDGYLYGTLPNTISRRYSGDVLSKTQLPFTVVDTLHRNMRHVIFDGKCDVWYLSEILISCM